MNKLLRNKKLHRLVIIFLVIVIYAFRNTRLTIQNTDEMQPTIKKGSIVLYSLIKDPISTRILPGTIITYTQQNSPITGNDLLIGRVLSEGPSRAMSKDGDIYIDNYSETYFKLIEPYVIQKAKAPEGEGIWDKVQPNSWLVLPDNRSLSSNIFSIYKSRAYTNTIVGKVEWWFSI